MQDPGRDAYKYQTAAEAAAILRNVSVHSLVGKAIIKQRSVTDQGAPL